MAKSKNEGRMNRALLKSNAVDLCIKTICRLCKTNLFQGGFLSSVYVFLVSKYNIFAFSKKLSTGKMFLVNIAATVCYVRQQWRQVYGTSSLSKRGTNCGRNLKLLLSLALFVHIGSIKQA